MNRKEKEKILLDGLGLKVGDKITITQSFYKDYEIIELEDKYALKTLEKSNIGNFPFDNVISTLLHYDFTKITPKKKKGELRCSNIRDCDNCPLYSLYCDSSTTEIVLYDILEKTNEYCKLDPRVYKVYKEILDEEVEG